MRFKNKGRKIYKTKEKNYYGKSPVGKVFSVGLTLLLVGGIGFIGYSVAEPILKYTKKAGDKDITQPVTMATEPLTDESSSGKPNGVPEAEMLKGYALSVNDMVNREILNSALARIPEDYGIEYVEVPLKVSGGKIYYASGVFTAVQSGAAAEGNMPLGEISSAITQAGYKPMALISTFNDNIAPATIHEIGYTTYTDGIQWIDDDAEAGGKPWASPFSTTAVNYNINIIDEVSGAGFGKVICSDFVFPEFRSTDVEILGEHVISPDRYMALTSAANTLYEHITNKGSSMMLEVSAADILSGKSDIMQPMLLKVNTLILDINIDEIKYGVSTGDTVYDFSGAAAYNVDKMLDLIWDEISGFNVVVKITGQNYNPSDTARIVEKLSEREINSYILS